MMNWRETSILSRREFNKKLNKLLVATMNTLSR